MADNTDDETFYIERIISQELGPNNKPVYFVKWEGYDSDCNTYETEEHLKKHFKNELAEYHRSLDEVPGPNRRFSISPHLRNNKDTPLQCKQEQRASKSNRRVENEDIIIKPELIPSPRVLWKIRPNRKRKVPVKNTKTLRTAPARPKMANRKTLLPGSNRVPERILQAKCIGGQKMLLIQFQSSKVKRTQHINQREWMPFKYIKKEFPQLLLTFFDAVSYWFRNDGGALPRCEIVMTEKEKVEEGDNEECEEEVLDYEEEVEDYEEEVEDYEEEVEDYEEDDEDYKEEEDYEEDDEDYEEE